MSNTHEPKEYKCSVIKPSNPFTNVCWVSVLTTFSVPPQILAASTVFFWPNSRNEEMMGDGFLVTAAGFVLNSKRLLEVHPVISITKCSSVRHFFHGVIPDAFEVRRIVCVEN